MKLMLSSNLNLINIVLDIASSPFPNPYKNIKTRNKVNKVKFPNGKQHSSVKKLQCIPFTCGKFFTHMCLAYFVSILKGGTNP